jgi:hypothetical protein
VQAPAIPKAAHQMPQRTTSRPTGAVAAPVVAVTPVVLQPMQAATANHPKQTPVSSAPPAVTVPLNPSPSPTQPGAANRQPPASAVPSLPAKTPPGQAKKLPGIAMTPPGHAKTPAGHAKTPPGQAKKTLGHAKMPPAPGPPAPAKHGSKAGWRNARPDLPGSRHGQVPQASPHTVGHHHRGVGHLAPPPARPAPATRKGGPEARTQDRGRGGKGSQGSQPPAPVAHGHGHNGNGKGDD